MYNILGTCAPMSYPIFWLLRMFLKFTKICNSIEIASGNLPHKGQLSFHF